ncbi:baseplate J/gp47 family protein [Clostridium butyricum]|uniref:baseplate J/gp47 family protein n=1 Tax=Clostridium butyricum TaxID=1492 RepID=UPI002330054C|nr:baseplate J/gp47 family protein [Clostridium butyricum]MDB2161190.1 baseplate J/gp47 family protein [Clostridium butyricum]
MYINFVDINAETVYEEIVRNVESDLGEKLHEGDEKKLFIKSLMPIIMALKNDINDTANQNFLENARDEKTDAIANSFFDTNRLKATKASCNGKAVLSEVQKKDILIPSGTKITSDGIRIFEIKEDYIVKAGEKEVDVKLISTSTGEKYNGIEIGKINHIIDPIAYVSEIYNTEISKEGSDIEDDKSYRERARLEMESKSCAGPEGAYEYYAYSADNSISAVKVVSPSPGTVRILVVVDNGESPSDEILKKVYDECSPRDRRPLTDKVETGTPEIVEYDIDLTYYLDKNFHTYEGKWRKAIEGENFDYESGAIRTFINWQQEDIGRSINVEELKFQILNSATYEVDNRTLSGVRKLIINSPGYDNIEEIQLAKVRNINVTYGGKL